MLEVASDLRRAPAKFENPEMQCPKAKFPPQPEMKRMRKKEYSSAEVVEEFTAEPGPSGDPIAFTIPSEKG